MVIQDFFLGSFYIILILVIGNFLKKRIKDAKYFWWGLIMKMIGAIGVYVVYFFYYSSGDTVYYFKRAKFIDSVLFNNFNIGIKLLFKNPKVYDPDTYGYFYGLSAFDPSSYIIAKICAITNLICFNSYLANALLFSAFSYYGIWKMYTVFSTIYPNNKKYIAISFLFIPSVFFWGSGVFKDTIIMGLIGLLIYGFYQIFFMRKKILTSLFLLLFSMYFIGVIKSYVLLALMPSMILWLFIETRNKINSPFLKNFSTPIFIIIITVVSSISLTYLSETFTKFNLDNMQSRAEDMQRWHTYTVENLQDGKGSAYNLGAIDYTPIGMLKKIPSAVNVSLFRPYVWEISSPIVVFSFFESTFLLVISMYLFLLVLFNIRKTLAFFNSNSSFVFFLVFSLIFAFSVGFTSYNFGALSRYRIPLLPFYTSFILILFSHLKNPSSKGQ